MKRPTKTTRTEENRIFACEDHTRVFTHEDQKRKLVRQERDHVPTKKLRVTIPPCTDVPIATTETSWADESDDMGATLPWVNE